MVKGIRLDLLLEEKGLLPSREAARAAIIDGGVLVNGMKITKPGTFVKEGAELKLTTSWQPKPYVGRGGLKLEKALKQFNIVVSNFTCLDIGASTGGFTDCLLKAGAKKVYAVDVGYGQLDWSLRSHSQVVVKERMNARNMLAEDLFQDGDQAVDFLVMDISFISILKVLPNCVAFLRPGAELVCLVKPQFEAGKERVGKGGVVREAAHHQEILQNTLSGAQRIGLYLKNLSYSPIKGPSGNIEFLAHFVLQTDSESEAKTRPDTELSVLASEVVGEAHAELNSR